MSLATRCPQCSTLFKVSTGQLQLQEGQVRCGHCENVFSGIEHLASADSTLWQNLQLDTPDQEAQQAAPPIEQTPHPANFLDTPRKRLPRLILTHWRTLHIRQKMTLVGLAVVLMGQLMWWMRVPLVTQVPPLARAINQSGPWVQNLFALPATTALQVDGSGLQQKARQMRVDVTLKNTSPLPSRWPSLKIHLLDSQGLVLASRTLTPNQYLKRSEQTGSTAPAIASQATVEVLAYLDIQTLAQELPESIAAGFKLELYDFAPNLF